MRCLCRSPRHRRPARCSLASTRRRRPALAQGDADAGDAARPVRAACASTSASTSRCATTSRCDRPPRRSRSARRSARVRAGTSGRRCAWKRPPTSGTRPSTSRSAPQLFPGARSVRVECDGVGARSRSRGSSSSSTRTRSATSGVDIANIKREMARRETAYRVIESYYHLIQGQRLIEVATASVEQLQAQLKQSKSFHDERASSARTTSCAQSSRSRTRSSDSSRCAPRVSLEQANLAVLVGLPRT